MKKNQKLMTRAEAMEACVPLFKWFESQGIEAREAPLVMASAIVAVNYGMACEMKRPMKDAKKGVKIICDIIMEMADDLVDLEERGLNVR